MMHLEALYELVRNELSGLESFFKGWRLSFSHEGVAGEEYYVLHLGKFCGGKEVLFRCTLENNYTKVEVLINNEKCYLGLKVVEDGRYSAKYFWIAILNWR